MECFEFFLNIMKDGDVAEYFKKAFKRIAMYFKCIGQYSLPTAFAFIIKLMILCLYLHLQNPVVSVRQDETLWT